MLGIVHYGMAVPEAPDELAAEALVFLVVDMTGHFKHPITYVLQDDMSSYCRGTAYKRLH